ncbi:MAG: CHAT domain-containing protein [Acidobacteriota bacterium]
MDELKSEEKVREYLLGRVSDETTLEGIEELLFTDEEYCSQVALEEDGIINDYVFGRLDDEDADSFRKTLESNPERRFKLMLTQGLRERALARKPKPAADEPSFFASLSAWFHQPKYVGAFAVLLIVVVGFAVYWSRRSNPDELAELRSIYQQARPTETRISEFGYAPLTQLRGAPEPGDQKRLRRIENNLLEATEKTSNARTHHALGVFYLTQQKYRDAVKELESALKFANQNPQIHNDLGVALFELSKTESKENKLENLARSLEEFTKATELDGNFLEALFNKSLALQEFGLPREAKESWRLYLQKDPSSPWADEARKNMGRIEGEVLLKSDEQVLSDFMAAYRGRELARAQKIHNETKGYLNLTTVPLQLSRRYLIAKQRGSDEEAKESLDALTFIGSFEQEQNADFFFLEFANFYTNVGADKIQPLMKAKDTFAGGLKIIESDLEKARAQFEKSRDLFTQLDHLCEAAIAEIWASQSLPDVAKITEGRQRLTAIIETAENRKFKVLVPTAYYWLGISEYLQNALSASTRSFKIALRLAEAGKNTFEVQHAQEAIAKNYSELGELEPALFYASKLLPDKGLYYQGRNEYWREKGRLADISLKLHFFSASLSFARERLTVIQENLPGNARANSQIITTLRHMVYAAAGRKDFDTALNYAHQSIQIALSRPDNSQNARVTGDVYFLLGDLKSKTKDCNQALVDYDRALELYGRLPELTVRSYQIHKGKLFCFEQLDRSEDFAGELENVLKLSEQYRAAIREDTSRQAFFTNEQAVFDAATANALKRHDNDRAFAFVETSKARSLLDFVESDKSITEVERSFGPVAQPLSLTEIQARLPDEVQFLQYAVLSDRVGIWVVSKTNFDLVEKQITSGDLETRIDAYQTLILTKGPPAEIRQAGQELYELLIPSNLAPEKQLCIVPDKSLHQLAFATLVSRAGTFLLEDHALFYAPSASVLVLATENARRKAQMRNESLLSVGNPAFDREDNPNLTDLQGAEAEAKVVASSYQPSLELLGGAATREAFLSNFAKVEVVHFAGHFVSNRQSPGNSKLLFSGGDLRTSELSQYKLPKAKLVVLSACETGFERYNKSEGAIGIARTLLALGSPVVVASQWKVDSEPTKDLMIAFHRNRKEKLMTSAESLRQAQLELLGHDKTSSPFYWAAFSLFGAYASY